MKPLAAFFGFVLIVLASPAAGGDRACSANPLHEPQPVLVLVEQNPWLMVVGSDSPRVAVYDDGLVIYWKAPNYRWACLSDDEVSALVQAVKLDGLNPSYMAARSTDQPTVTFLRADGRGGLRRVSVYGDMSVQAVRANVPAALSSAYDRLVAIDPAGAERWLPARIEVMIWPYEYAPEPSVVWPSKWPGLDTESTWARGDGYSLYVPSSDYEELMAFLKTRNERGAVEVGGKKWATSYRFPFPAEDRWMGAGD